MTDVLAFQKPTVVKLEDCQPYFLSSDYVVQVKLPGTRYRIESYQEGFARVWNQNSDSTEELYYLAQEFLTLLPLDSLVEGVTVPNESDSTMKFAVHDCLRFHGTDISQYTWKERLDEIDYVRVEPSHHIGLQAYVAGEDRKRSFQKQLWDQGKPGLYFKKLTAPYTAGEFNPGVVQVNNER